MRRFVLKRHQDVSGISGTGVVAEGVVLSNGRVVTSWLADISQTCIWQSLDEIMTVHGHNGATELVWIDAN